MVGRAVFAVLVVLSTLAASRGADVDPAELRKKPITTVGGEVGDLLRQWWKEGTAAGNVGDWYDNRDGGHSDLNTAPYPQLQRVLYTDEDIKLRRHWAAQRITRPQVVFGNSSTSAPPHLGGSNIRLYYTSPLGLALLYNHYRRHNLYIYPEHRDHDPGHNGHNDGWGDLYPTNTPYLLASQGSSGSDQPFMRAIPLTLAAFRPDVKKKLIDSGLLMPTVQMILRSTNKHLKDSKEYLTGKAHPTVFEGAWVNDLAMVKLAHAITLDTIPPLVQMKVLEEDATTPGVDFFDPAKDEKLTDTPAVIARLWRGKNYQRRLVVSAKDSLDINKRPLTFYWKVLRGDGERIKIKPLNEANSVVELLVPYHERRPVTPGSPLASNRVDIGVFVHNGVYHSAPGFVTFYSLDSEGRTYDEQGRILEIGHGLGETTLQVTDWSAFFQVALTNPLAGRVLHWSEQERTLLQNARQTLGVLEQPYEAARKKSQQADEDLRQAEAARKQATEQLAAARKAHALKASEETKAALAKGEADVAAREAAWKKAQEAQRAGQKEMAEALKKKNDFLDRPPAPGQPALRGLVQGRLQEVARSADFCHQFAQELTQLAKAGKEGNPPPWLQRGLQNLVRAGLAKESLGLPLTLQPLHKADAGGQVRLTVYERFLLERFQAELLGNLIFPKMVSHGVQENYVDHRLALRKAWRDVYRYDAQGSFLGWTRYSGEGPTHFHGDGVLILEKDALGRCSKGRTVRYEQEAAKGLGPNPHPLRSVLGDTIVTYEYAGPRDVQGRIASRTPVQK